MLKSIRKLLTILGLLLLQSSPAVAADPGCSGEFWNPLELDFTMLAPIRIGIPPQGYPMTIMPNNNLPDPPEHKAYGCNCPDGLKTPLIGMGMTYWLPSYLMDLARTPGCIGFLGGVQVLQKYRSLAGTENQNGLRGLANLVNTTRQRHFGHADITSILKNDVFEKCGSVAKGINIASMTEVCFPCQSDVWAALLVPVSHALAANPLLSTMACGAVRLAAMMGSPQMDYFCNFSGTRFPLSQTTPPGASSAQEINADHLAKHFTLAHLTGGGLRTMGDDTVCAPVSTAIWNPSKLSYQQMYPEACSYLHNDPHKLLYACNKPRNTTGVANETAAAKTADATETAAPGSALEGMQSRAKAAFASLAAPLNYPTKEHGYIQIWEAKTCCVPLITVEDAVGFVAGNILPKDVAKVLKTIQSLKKVMETLQTIDSLGQLVALSQGAVGAGVEGAAATPTLEKSLGESATNIAEQVK